MKGVIAALLIAAAIAGGSVWYTSSMQNISEQLLEINDSISEKIEHDDLPAAVSEIERLRALIDDKRTFLTATGNHTRLDEIEMSVSELMSYTKSSQSADAYTRCRALAVMIEHLPRDYRIEIENIF